MKTVWKIDLSAVAPKWKEIDACPGGGRMLSVAAGLDGAFWLVGGVDLIRKGEKIERRYLKDAYRYDPEKGWKRIADLPHPVVAAPTPAPAIASGFTILGGDDGSQVGVDPDKHRGFSTKVLRFDARANKWAEAGELPAPRVTVPCVPWNKAWVVPSGEMCPGIRSPEVWALAPGKKE